MSREYIQRESSEERFRRFFDECCDAIGVQYPQVLEKRRDDRRMLEARKALAWAMKEKFADASFPAIGRLMRRDHTTVMYGAAEFRKALQREAPWALQLRTKITGMGYGVAGIESPLDFLRRCEAADSSAAIDMPKESTG